MKIGIMSMQRILNYGSLMQAYALKKIIEEQGDTVEFVDYRIQPDVYNKNNVISIIKCAVKNVLRQSRTICFISDRIKRVVQKDYSHRSIFYTFYPRLNIHRNYKYKSKVDMLIIGSDEVFNCLQAGNTVGYSLDLFGRDNNARRVITYAASFGSTRLTGLKRNKVLEEIKERINKLDDISVRDDNSSKIVEHMTNKKPSIHLDPVLVGLIENDEWTPCMINKYVIIYGYYKRFSHEECNIILDFAHKKGLSVIALGEEQKLFDQYLPCRPDELISYFQNASYIITDTFHGTIFSIICHKQFVTIPRSSKNEMGGNEEKIDSLLDILMLQNRKCTDIKDIEKIAIEPIDYTKVDEIRQKERQRTIQYLQRNKEEIIKKSQGPRYFGIQNDL